MCSTLQKSCLTLALAMGIASVLQGCGGGGTPTPAPTPKPTPSPATVTATVTVTKTTTTTTTVTTTGTAAPRTAPMSVEEAVKYLNTQYMAYDFEHPHKKTPLGVTLSFADQPDNFDKNIYCHEYMNTACFKGFSDCRMSASLFNWKMISNNYIWATTFGRPTGYVFNQTLVETTMGKCSYMFDGASENRLNNGCGTGAGSDCSQPNSAYADICHSTGKVCTADDGEVKGSYCKPFGILPQPPAGDKGYQCFFSGAAINYPKMDKPNHLREMVIARMANELNTSNYADHNEVIIDERPMMQAIWRDPAVAIPAFVYAQSKEEGPPGNARLGAEKMRDLFSKTYQVGKIPVVGINDVTSFMPGGPFFIPPTKKQSFAEVVV